MKIFILCTFVLSIIVAATVAAAQRSVICGERSKMVGYLERNYRETRSGIGIASSGALVELYTAKNGTWTMLVTRPGGPTCVMGSGEAWERARRIAPFTGDEPLDKETER